MIRRALPLPLLMLIGATAAQAQSMTDRAEVAASASRARTSDSSTLLHNYVSPGLAGQAVTTIDGRTRFTAALACEKTAKWLELLVQPSSSGDLGTVRISRDTDFDGAFDTEMTLPIAVSGICANGIISCTVGTWNGCKDFQWGVDGGGALKLNQVDMPNLSSCYCINNSCGQNLAWNNMASVLADLGGGVVGALTSANPHYGVAEAQISGPVIDYVGASMTACTSSPQVGQIAYASNPTAIQADAASQAAGNGIFQMLKGSPAGIGNTAQTRRCTIQRQVTMTSPTYDEIVAVSGSVENVTPCGTGCRRYRIGGTGNCTATPPTFSANFSIAEPDRLVSARIVDAWAEDWTQARLNGTAVASAGKKSWLTDTVPSANCEQDGDFSSSAQIDFTDTAKSGSASLGARVYAGGNYRSGYIDVEIRVDLDCGASEQLVDLCSGYDSDSQCQLLSESVDGVATVVGGVHTGLTPLHQTRQFGSASCTLSLTRDFFERDRAYRCIIDSGTTPEPDLSRSAYIIDHSTETLLADQTRNADGTVTTTNSAFSLPSEPSVPACEAICKTRAATTNIAAAPAGVVGTQQNVTTGWNVFYHACLTGNVCPAGPGEQVVSACGCLNEFPEAVVMMQTVRLAGSDLTCNASAP